MCRFFRSVVINFQQQSVHFNSRSLCDAGPAADPAKQRAACYLDYTGMARL
jgi:hypothetical protein